MNTELLSHCKAGLKNASFARLNWVDQSRRDPKKLWLDKNENADPKIHSIAKKALTEIEDFNLYSYPESGYVYQKLADYLNISPENLIIASGSDGAIRAVFEAFINKGDRVLYTDPTFAMYSIYPTIYEAESVVLPYEPSPAGPMLSIDAFVNKILSYTPKLVCLANPGSPTGTILSPEELKLIIETAHAVNALVLIDEAYYPFYAHTVISWIEHYPHLLVTRSTGKAWGLAGFRIGFAVGSKPFINALHKVKSMYETSTLAFAVLAKMLDYTDEIIASVSRLQAGKEYFINELNNLGFETLKSYGNFMHVKFGSRSEAIHTALSDLVYYRKDFKQPCLKGYSRFSSTTVEQFKPIVALLKEICS